MIKSDAVYARQSVEKKDSLSISGQIELCRRAAGANALKVYQDVGYSGKNTERPAFQKLLGDIRTGRIGKLYVYRLDRFSRSVADFGQLWNVLQKHGVEFVSVSESFDTSTPMGRAMLHIIMVFAQLERETTAERVRDNYYRRASLGCWPGGPAPFGFDNGRVRGADGREIPTLIANDRSAAVQRIFSAYAEDGVSLSQLARALTREGIAGPKRSQWDSAALSRLLHNPAYVRADEQVRLYYLGRGVSITDDAAAFDGIHGLLLVGKRRAGDRKYTDLRHHTLSVLGSEGLVSSALFLRCQEKLAANRQLGNNGKGTHTWLSGLLKCAKCGYSISVSTDGRRRYMTCSGRYRLAHCGASIRTELSELEDQVQRGIEDFLINCPKEAVTETGCASAAAELAELDRRAERLIDAFTQSDSMSADYVRRALDRLAQQREYLRERERHEQNRPAAPREIRFAQLSFEEKKAVAAQLIHRISVSENGAEIVWRV